MITEEEIRLIKSWIDNLVGKRLSYISGRNFFVIDSADWSGNGKIVVIRNNDQKLTISFDNFETVLEQLNTGKPVHVDSVLRGGGNYRTVIETIFANFPTVGYMENKKGRNKSSNKVIQLMSEEVHNLGDILDVSDDYYKPYLLSSYSPDEISFLSKPFLLLAGISGTGKTRFVREQAKQTGSLAETYCLTSVRPDWHEPSDLLGYVSRLSGSAEFVVTDVLKFIAKAWREILDKGISLSVNEKLLCLQGGVSDIDAIKPYWLCLDEMNLAPVEQYFADYLSVIETRCWAWDEDDFQYSCDPLLKATTIQSIDNIERLREELGFADANYDDAWQHICEYGLSIPFNLIVAGTVNMDETTHGFSRKVIDRALSFDFGDFFPNDFDNFFAPTTTNKALSYPIYSDARTSADKLPKIDIDGCKSIAFINAINNVLAHTPFKLAYRALNELLLAVISSEPEEEIDLKAVWDDFLMCKVLPRIEGDTEKLAAIGAVDISILKQLEEILKSEFGSFWNELPGSDKARPDLYRENVDGDKLIHIACRSKEKINWMESRLATFGFTSFWP
ncbi:MAG: hypothetical protein ACJAVX_000708 [Pseudoalteromonas rhizosphaerae]|jgi:hypothetical protein|uniref:McrB family protein n=1 Tax=Pseudoalteromonas TaxID=53246 RepID=UPI001C729CE1|nr:MULTISPECIES: DUF3578 domain-containing protein [Pseudoalteromonas]